MGGQGLCWGEGGVGVQKDVPYSAGHVFQTDFDPGASETGLGTLAPGLPSLRSH